MPFLHRPGAPTLHYTIDDHTDPWRDAPWLILQHGYGRSGVFWRSWIPYLSRFYRVVCPDLRGLGQSPAEFDPAAAIHVDGFIDDLTAIMDHVAGGAPVHYCGESLGGILGIEMGATMPQRLRSLTLLAAPVTIPKQTQEAFACGHASWQDALRIMGSKGWSEAVNAATRFPPDADPALLRWYAEEMGKSPVEVLIALSRVAATVDVSGHLPEVAVPTLGLYPTAGVVTGHEEAQIRAGIRGIRVINLPTRFHAIQVLMPAACARSLLHFCGELDGVANHE
jgi:3-oxoadipate enol-lactonase